MSGLVLHVLAGLGLVALLQLRGYDWRVQTAGFVGNIIPDVVSFGAAILHYRTLDIGTLGATPFLNHAAAYSHGEFAFVFVAFLAGTLAILYDAHVLRNKLFAEYEEIDIALGIGIAVHIVMDILITESGVWI